MQQFMPSLNYRPFVFVIKNLYQLRQYFQLLFLFSSRLNQKHWLLFDQSIWIQVMLLRYLLDYFLDISRVKDYFFYLVRSQSYAIQYSNVPELLLYLLQCVIV